MSHEPQRGLACVLRPALLGPLVTLRFAPLVATLLLSLARLDAAEIVVPQLEAANSRVTPEESVFSGNARFVHQDVILRADEIVFRNREQIAIARGNVIFIRGAQRLVAEEITYRVQDRTFSVGRFRVGQGDFLAEGEKAEGTPANMAASGITLHHGEPEPINPRLRTRTISYEEAENKKDSVARIEGARLGIGPVDILPLPTLSETPNDPSFVSLDARASYSSNLGGELSVAAMVAATDTLQVGADVGLFTKRGVLLGPIAKYDTRGVDGLGASGTFRSGYIHDQGDPEFDYLREPIRHERGYVEWKHVQRLDNDVTLAGELNYWSDSFITRDFRRDSYRNVQTPDTWLEAQKLGDNFVVSLFTRVQVNDYALFQERLPEVRFDGLPVELAAGIYHRINASFAILREDSPLPTSTGTIHSQRADLYYGAMRPFSPREWFSVTPVAGVRVTHYADTPTGVRRGNYTRVLGEAGFDSEFLTSSGTWNYQNKRWNIDGLRHLITPTIGYRYSPSADVGRGSIPAIDDDPFNTYLRPLGIANRRDVDRLPALNTFRFAIDQKLQTRDPNYGSRDLAQLTVAIDQHLDADAATTQGSPRNASDLHSFLAINPAAWLRYDLYSRTTVQNGSLQELNTGLTIRDANVWSFRLGTHYLEDLNSVRRIQEYTATYGLRLNEIYSLVARLRYDSRRGEFTEQGLTFSQRLSRFWTAHYEFSAYDGPRREGDYGVSVSLEAESL